MKKIIPMTFLLVLLACTQNPEDIRGEQLSSTSAVFHSTASSVPSSTATTTSGSLKIFTDSVRKFSIGYPTEFTILTNDNITTQDYEVTGTSFVFPESYATGNTLSEAKAHVAVQPTCPSIQSSTTSGVIVRNGVTYSTADWSGVGAGNLYQGRSYTTVHDNSCYILTLYLHSCNLGPDCYAGHTTPFEKQMLVNVFEKMVNTFLFLP